MPRLRPPKLIFRIGILLFPKGTLVDHSVAIPAPSSSGTSVGSLTLATKANFVSEAPQTHSSQLTNFAPELRQITSHSVVALKPCEWKDNKGAVCGELVGWHCQDHLGSVYGIVSISSSTLVMCGACDEEMKRKSFLRRFKERHLACHRSKRNAACNPRIVTLWSYVRYEKRSHQLVRFNCFLVIVAPSCYTTHFYSIL
ncbi:hypothetical protein EDC04DRAFT_2607734 [Pisolithus marmoratus]|nr:hypothetical protein EDC04DRAFT_2607734 [Pisolithus marmoratus]